MNPSAGKKLLLHCCCAPCGTHPFRTLRERFDVTAYFDNPNIQPAEEYRSRLSEIHELAKRWGFSVIEGTYDSENWFSAIRGHENEPEGAARCEICYRIRLERTARMAETCGMNCFATTLSVSPHKKTEVINRIGRQAGDQIGIQFVEADFKKKDGFKISCELSRAEGLYRQDYCGCTFSRRGSKTKINQPGLFGAPW
jgi:predicted adenine nucleotide alpha hydrolase (AANH) superfamily ATPase